RYINNKLREAIQHAILAHDLDCSKEAQAEKRDYIELVDISMRVILKEEVNTQLPWILPQADSNFATPVIEKNVIESLKVAVLARSSSQLKSTCDAAASLTEFEITKIFIDKMEKNKSYDKADYKRKLYDALTEGRKEASQARKSSHPENQEFDMGNNDEQPADKEVSKADWFKKPERPNLFPPLYNLELTIRRRSRTDPTLLNNSEMATEGNGDLPVPDLRTMEELC
nr:hypothetical protein [Tanacetum cinerariifolium]